MTDADLVARLKQNDERAYREVLDRYGDQLFAYLVHLTGDPALAEDIVGETYLRMVERIGSYTFTGAPFKAWLYRIAHNLAINALKRSSRIVGVNDLDRVLPPITDPALRVVRQIEAEELRTALGYLTDDQRQVLLLRFVAALSTSEIAALLERNENAVKQLQFRALRALERQLQR